MTDNERVRYKNCFLTPSIPDDDFGVSAVSYLLISNCRDGRVAGVNYVGILKISQVDGKVSIVYLPD